MGLPNILIEFKTKASTAIRRGERGIVAVMVIEDTAGVWTIENAEQIPSRIEGANKAYIERAFMGGVNPVRQVLVIAADTVANGLIALEPLKFDYLAPPPTATAAECTEIVSFIKGLRDSKGIKSKAVLPNTKADHEGIINFTTGSIKAGDMVYTSGEYCSRIAGLLAGTPLQQSSTYFVLSEVSDVPKFTKAELDSKIDAGEFVIFHDGEKVKVGRGVNSLVTITEQKGEDYKYIKIIDIMDMIYTDVKRTCEDNYIGKFPNNYDNKCNLIVAVQAYLEALRKDEILDTDVETAIDIAAQTQYLKDKGEPVLDMNEQEIKEANTGTYVFLQARLKILNAIEDITINFFI